MKTKRISVFWIIWAIVMVVSISVTIYYKYFYEEDLSYMRSSDHSSISTSSTYNYSTYNASSSSSSDEYLDTVRCYYCSKVIRSDGVNIHGTPTYNGGVLICDYCGHKTSITK